MTFEEVIEEVKVPLTATEYNLCKMFFDQGVFEGRIEGLQRSIKLLKELKESKNAQVQTG